MYTYVYIHIKNIYIYICIITFGTPLQGVGPDFQDASPAPLGVGDTSALSISIPMQGCKQISFHKSCICIHMHAYTYI